MKKDQGWTLTVELVVHLEPVDDELSRDMPPTHRASSFLFAAQSGGGAAGPTTRSAYLNANRLIARLPAQGGFAMRESLDHSPLPPAPAPPGS
jgi:hypothetical protein